MTWREDAGVPPLDLRRALAWSGGKALLLELVGLFLEDAPRRLEELRAAVRAGDAPRAERVAHSIKGAAANLGAETARAVAEELETICREARLDGATDALGRLDGELGRVIAFLSTPGWEERL